MGLRAGAHLFYPLHIALLNETEGVCRALVASGLAIVEYLPVSFASNEEADDDNKQKFTRLDNLLALHESITNALKKIYEMAYVGSNAMTRDMHYLRMHIILVSYVCDIPEAEDMLSITRGVQPAYPCH